jgi:type IV secretory pathway TrbD component
MGYSARFGYALWAIAQALVIHYGQWQRNWFSALGHGAGFGYALWAVAQNKLP